MKIFVAKLPPEYDEYKIAELFITYGDISTINLVTDRETGRSKGYAFVEMPNDEDALNAISHLDQLQVSNNNQLSVSQAQERPRTPNTGYNRNAPKSGGYQRNNNFGNNRHGGSAGGYTKDRRPNGGFNRNTGNNETER